MMARKQRELFNQKKQEAKDTRDAEREARTYTITLQEYAGAPVVRQVLVLRAVQDVDWRPLFHLNVLKAPGLPDIKWNELYAKWGRFIPEDRKSGLKYYMQEPPVSVKQKIAQQTAEARRARDKRSRDGNVPVSTPKRSKNEEAETAQKQLPDFAPTK